jgi:hypothetical protein
MEPNSLGRKFGIGLRVAGNIARQRAQEAARAAERSSQNASEKVQGNTGSPPASSAPSRPVLEVLKPVADAAQRGRALGQGLSRGTKSFGKSFFRPFAQASGVLWLEVTGCFFALFTAFFAQNLYQLRASWASGAQHSRFLLYVGLTVVFFYFSASSFLKARAKARRHRAEQGRMPEPK